MGLSKKTFFGILTLFIVLFYPSVTDAGSCKCGRFGMGAKIDCYQGVNDQANCSKILGNFNQPWERGNKDSSIDHYLQCTFIETDDCDNIKRQMGALVDLKANPLSEDETVVKVEPVAPVLQINIPTILPFTTEGLKANAEGYAYIPFIGQYFVGIYKWAMMIGGLVAAIMIIFGGFTYLISRGNAQQIEEAKSRITGAIFGLALLFGSYAMLYLINPDLVQFKGLKIQVIEFKSLTSDLETEEESVNGTMYTQLVTIAGDNIVNTSRKADTALVDKLKIAAANLKAHGISLFITDGFRTVDKQKEKIAENCKNPPGSAKCEPLPGKVQTCILKDGEAKNCPHTTGVAVDVWGRGSECKISQKDCKTDMATDPCRQDPCQAMVIAVMQDAGFCNYTGEAWHFESVKNMSPCALPGTISTRAASIQPNSYCCEISGSQEAVKDEAACAARNGNRCQ